MRIGFGPRNPATELRNPNRPLKHDENVRRAYREMSAKFARIKPSLGNCTVSGETWVQPRCRLNNSSFFAALTALFLSLESTIAPIQSFVFSKQTHLLAIFSTAAPTLVMLSASSSVSSMLNSSSMAMVTSTVSSESKPRSVTKDAVGVI